VTVRTYAALTGAGFRRYATYRQAMVGGAVANVMFGFLRCYVLLSIASTGGTSAGRLAGYAGPQLVAYVWLGQGLLAVVASWDMIDLADRVRTGDVTADLLRPVAPFASYLCTDLGRSGFMMLTRFAVPLLVGGLAFDLYLPRQPLSYPLFLVSVLLAELVGFNARYLIGLTAFWLLEVRGVVLAWTLTWGVAAGLFFPLPVLPGWLQLTLWLATPFPATLQGPLDVAVERGGLGHAALVLADQAAWLLVGLAVVRIVQRRAWRKLVVQGG
jgi:ABC-2 type transport system permease protein